MAGYLRVKNWKEWQHYKDREPPWVKIHSKLLRDSAFCELNEQEQWQLVRVWLVVSSSSRYTLDEHGRVVQVVVEDEQALRRSIQSIKKVPLAKFISEGWLIRVPEDTLVKHPTKDADDSEGDQPGLPPDLSDASTVLAQGYRGASTLLEVEGRGREHFVSDSKAGSCRDAARANCLPDENELLLARLLRLCKASADNGTEAVFRSYAAQLPPAALAKVIETTEQRPAAERARYANGALQSEINERSAA